MSTTDVIVTPDPAAYEYARESARQRAAYQWEDEDRWNLWNDFDNKVINPDWFDPWFEWETTAPANNPDTDPQYQMLQNLYYCYCWFKLRGYNNYAICGMMSSAIQESNISGGQWERGPVGESSSVAHHPYESMLTFDPTSTYDSGSAYPWYYGGSYPVYAGSQITWTASFTDYSEYRWYRSLTDWNAVKRYPLKTDRYFIDGVGMREMPVGSVQLVSPGVYAADPSANNTSALVLDYNNPGYAGDGRGYGFCQWTPFAKIPRTLAYGYTDLGFEDFNQANRHWQMSGTMQLMLWELERYISMNESSQTGSSYYGQWIDSRVASQSQDGAYFIWPYDPNNLNNPALWHFYGMSCSWDEYAAGSWIPRTRSIIESLEQFPDMQDEDKDWCLRQMALAIYRSAFLQATYADFNFQERTYYILDCIKYWDNHPLIGTNNQGWDIHDIPRPRDVPYCALDAYHLTKQKYLMLGRRRKPQNVRTILL